MSDNHANSEADRSGRATAPSLRDRIAKVQAEHQAPGNACLCGWEYDPLVDDSHFDHVADAVIRELLPAREGRWGWLDGTVSTNPQTGNPIKLEIEPGEVNPLSVEDALQVGLALLAAVVECEEAND